MDFEGEFETHVTVRALDPADLATLRAWAGREGLAVHHIVLDAGRTPSQPMIGRRGRGALPGQRDEADALCRRLAAAGFAPVRVKVEAHPDNAGVPGSDGEAARHPGRYFEHHVKLVLGPGADLAALAAVAGPHAARASRNAFRARADGRDERFITQRCHAAGRATARARLAALLAALAAGGYEVVSVEEEYVVIDTDPGVDAGWLDPGGA